MSNLNSMPSQLFDLSTSLSRAMDSGSRSRANEFWGNPAAMSKSLAGVRKRFDSPLIRSNRQSVTMAVAEFRRSGKLAGFLETKYVCIGASENFSGWCLLQDERLLNALLRTAGEGTDRRRLKCVSCLLRSYWSFPRFSDGTAEPAQKGWLTLRKWLADQTRALKSSEITKPLWFQTLNHNPNLLGDDPCKPYEHDLLAGESVRLNEAFTNLGIPADSWLREEAVLAQVKAGAGLNDAGFKSCMTQLIAIACGETDFKLSKNLSIRCIARLVSRYAESSVKPEHFVLRDSAIAFIGNPWLHRAAWDSHVLTTDGRPDVEARQMLNSWLKVRLIKDFFDLLSEDRSADGRRLNYWLRFEPMIDDMWFVLGSDAMTDKRKDYVDFRQRAKGRLLDLVGTTPTENNAFLMHIGQYVIVEFGLVGNACFVYRYDNLPADIKRRLKSEVYRAQIDIAYLKVSGHRPRLLHQGAWEPRFDDEICPLLGSRPPTRKSNSSPLGASLSKSFVVVKKGPPKSSTQTRTSVSVAPLKVSEFERILSKHRLQISDLRSKGGCLWVLTDDLSPLVRVELKALGFAYKPGKGWWRE
jgi:hypothetical protein